jgi:hypothetical protein
MHYLRSSEQFWIAHGRAKLKMLMVGAEGFAPPTLWSQVVIAIIYAICYRLLSPFVYRAFARGSASSNSLARLFLWIQ